MGVRTRKSLPDASTTAAAAAADSEETLADLDGKEARRLQTNAKFDKHDKGPSLGTYHWRGAVYAIEPHTPREWIVRGEAEWAEMVRKRERRKREREEEAEGRRREKEEAERKRVEREEAERKMKQSVKRKSVEMETKMDSMTLKKRRTEVSKNKVETREKDAGSSTSASSNIHVVHRRPVPTIRLRNDQDELPSEDDSADLPTLADMRISTTTTTSSSSTRQHKSKPPTSSPSNRKAEAIQDLTTNLWSLAKINDRLDILRKWYDGQNTAGAYQRIVVIAKKIRDEKGGVANQRERAELRRFSQSVGSDNVEMLLNQAVEEEERRMLKGGDDLDEGDKEDVEMMGTILPTPDVEDLAIRHQRHQHQDRRQERHQEQEQHQRSSTTTTATIFTPPASDSSSSDPTHLPSNHTSSSAIAIAEAIHHRPTPPPSDSSSSLPQEHLLLEPPSYTTHDTSGNPQRWSFNPALLNDIKLKFEEMRDPERAEFAIVEKRRLEGESRTQRRRRVRRELRVLEGRKGDEGGVGEGGEGDSDGGVDIKEIYDGWTIITDPQADGVVMFDQEQKEEEDDDEDDDDDDNAAEVEEEKMVGSSSISSGRRERMRMRIGRRSEKGKERVR